MRSGAEAEMVAKGNFIFILYPSEMFDFFPFSIY